jgi:hypothetical protein
MIGANQASIVFVHGLTGNRESTWTHAPSKVCWPEKLLKNDIPEARIMSFGYDADVVHFWSEASQNRVGNHAQDLLSELTFRRLRSRTVSNVDSIEEKILLRTIGRKTDHIRSSQPGWTSRRGCKCLWVNPSGPNALQLVKLTF